MRVVPLDTFSFQSEFMFTYLRNYAHLGKHVHVIS